MDEKNIPLLISFYFGENARVAQRGASRRLFKWSRAFEGWLAERKVKFTDNAVKNDRLTWRRLARQCGKMPWELRREDVEVHMRWMQEEGYAKGTINKSVGCISSFYEWCSARGVDNACGQGFNPAREVVRIGLALYEKAVTWSREEVGRLLELVGRDTSVLGRRELAFFRLRLSSGVLHKDILQLKWEQIEQDGEGVSVRWREGGERVKLEAEAWRAIRDWLVASGRLRGMEKGKYIFTPLRFPDREDTGRNAEDWLEQALSYDTTRLHMMRYGKLVGVSEGKLNWNALKATAVRLRLEAGESLEGIEQFMQSREGKSSIKFKLKKLPALAEDEGEAKAEVAVPVRQPRHFKLGEGATHGIYSRSKDPKAVREVMDEGTRGVEQETKCLRELMEGMVERGLDDESSLEAYSMSAGRLAELVAAGRALGKGKEEKWVEEWLAECDKKRRRNPIWPSSEQVRAEAARRQGEGMQGNVREETATIRVLLRKVYLRANTCEDEGEYRRLVDLYGQICLRLVKMVKLEGVETDQVGRHIRWSLEQAVRETRQEMGLDGEGSVTDV